LASPSSTISHQRLAPQPVQRNRPVRLRERISSIDSLRGFALFRILVINIEDSLGNYSIAAGTTQHSRVESSLVIASLANVMIEGLY
jgi:uncharacterized membrane protein YeiB